MVELNVRRAIFVIFGLILAVNVHGSKDNEDAAQSNRNKRMVMSNKIEYFISSEARTWTESNYYCFGNGYILARVNKPNERDALIAALKYHNFPNGTKFWIYTCNIGADPNCAGRCTALTYGSTTGLVVDHLTGNACNLRKRYICEK